MINTSQQVQVYRSGLQRTRAKLAQGTLTIGYIGGSITDGRAVHNWPYPVTGWFADRFPTVRICEENAAIGATGSPLAAFRAQHDLIDRNCDLVFVEYAVNDNGLPSDERRRTREGLLRQLLAGEGRDIIIVYTYCQDMYADMVAGQIPVSIREFEELADHYGIPSVWMGLHAFNDVKAGRMRWEEWLPDGLHPQDRGSYSYAQSV
ncbi:MAG TPA: SGNH/GDSL hydrolase family protein, partial [Armatimonadota bacterium]|nr:SGNH/GDSL hydrolase family protein [Armatimonadota bacterium]